jgi:hypothetical protein
LLKVGVVLSTRSVALSEVSDGSVCGCSWIGVSEGLANAILKVIEVQEDVAWFLLDVWLCPLQGSLAQQGIAVLEF